MPGQLVVVVDTDMALPDQVDTIELIVTVPDAAGGTKTLYDNPLIVGRGLEPQPIPATLTLLPGPDPSVAAAITVVGWKGGVARTLRQVKTTVPTDRAATLRMPIQWLCDGMVSGAGGGDGGMQLESSCGPDATCRAGTCVPRAIDPTSLPRYTAEAVFGGGSAPAVEGGTTEGTCFDTIACMVGGNDVTPDDPTNCTIPIPPDTSTVNVALRVAGDGICDTTGETCFVTLNGNSDEGWVLADGLAALPPAVCDKLRTGQVQAVVVSSTCPTKTASTPACGPWSSVTQAPDSSVAAAVRHVDAAAIPPSPTLLATLLPEGGAALACCPLLADSSKLYTCVCDGTGPTQVVAIDPTTGSASAVGSFTPQFLHSLGTPYAAAMGNSTAGTELYWVDRPTTADGGTVSNVEQTVVSPASTAGLRTTVLGPVPGDLYDTVDILSDATNLYALADQVAGLAAGASGVQLVKIDRSSGAWTPLDTGGATPVFQFTQDANAVYVAVDTDEALGPDAGISRTSQILAFPKSGNASRVVLEQVTLTTPDEGTGGVVGLADDGTSLFALYESAPAADGTLQSIVYAIPTSLDAGRGTWPPRNAVYQETHDPRLATLRLLGAINGSVVLARDVAAQVSDAGLSTAAQSAVIVVPSSGASPRVVASFDNDGPLFEVQAPSFTADAFWLNASGRVFRLPAGALQ